MSEMFKLLVVGSTESEMEILAADELFQGRL
jgi:hypothetical protein